MLSFSHCHDQGEHPECRELLEPLLLESIFEFAKNGQHGEVKHCFTIDP